jgi:predicted phage terminase large subunit-like protein
MDAHDELYLPTKGATDDCVLDAILRHDLAGFIQKCFDTVAPGRCYLHNWHINVIAWHLERCLFGDTKRLIITLPPRHLKSICASVAFPAWALGHVPSSRIIVASYSEGLAGRHALDCRAIIEAEWYRRLFPGTRLHPEKKTELEIMTTARGFRLATSVGGTLTGRGGNIIIIDDPLKPGEAMSDLKREAVNQWFDGTLYSRLDNKAEDKIIIIMQRLHTNDLVGHVTQLEDWTHVNIPAIAEMEERFEVANGVFVERQQGEALHPDREPRRILNDIRARVGNYHFSAQYQQSPVPRGGGMIKRAWLENRIVDPASVPSGARKARYWDFAATPENPANPDPSWTCGARVAYLDGVYWVVDMKRLRGTPLEVERIVASTAEDDGGAVAIWIEEEPGSGGKYTLDHFQRHILPGRAVRGDRPQGPKAVRADAFAAAAEAGNVHLVEGSWIAAFLDEAEQFPMGRHNDQVDAVAGACRVAAARAPALLW